MQTPTLHSLLRLVLLATISLSSHATQLIPILQKGHTAPILALAVSRDSQYAATAGAGRVIKIWDLNRGRELHSLAGHTGVISALAFSANDRYLLSAEAAEGYNEEKQRIFVWDFASGKNLKTIVVNTLGGDFSTAHLTNQLLSADGRLIDINTSQTIRTFKQQGKITATAFSADDLVVAFGNKQGEIVLYATHSGRVLARLKHKKSITSLQFSADGKQLLSASYDGNAILWDITQQQRLKTFAHAGNTPKNHRSKRAVLAAIFSHDGKQCITTGNNSSIMIWDRASGKMVRRIKTEYVVDQLALQHQPDYIVSSSREMAIDLWHPITGQQVRSLQERSRTEEKLLIDPEGKWLFSVSNSKKISVWNLETGLLDSSWNPNVGDITDISLAQHNPWIAISGEAKHVTVWNYETGAEQAYFTANRTAQPSDTAIDQVPFLSHNAPITGARFVKSDRYLITIAADGEISVWDGKQQRRIDHHSVGEALIALAISPAGDTLATGSYSGSVHLWNIGQHGKLTGRMNLKHRSAVYGLAFSSSGEQLHTSSQGKHRSFDLNNKTVIKPSLAIAGNIPFNASHSGDGRYIAVGSKLPPIYEEAQIQKTLLLWNAQTRQPIDAFSDYQHSVTAVQFHPHRAQLIVAFEGGIDILDIERQQRIATLTASRNNASTIVTPEGYFNNSINDAGLFHLLNPETKESSELNQYESMLKKPAIIKARLQGAKIAAEDKPHLSIPPRLRLLSHDASSSGDSLSIHVQSDTIVSDIKIYTNGTPQQRLPISAADTKITITLPPEKTSARTAIYAFNRDGTASKPLLIDRPGSPTAKNHSTLHILAIGIDQYIHLPEWELEHAASDALSFATTVERYVGKTFSTVKKTVLLNEQASRTNITQALDQLSSLPEDAMAVVMIAGHGVRHEKSETFFLLAHDTKDAYRPTPSDAIHWHDFKKSLRSTQAKVLIFLDACHSAALTDERIVNNNQLATALFDDQRSGHLIFSAAQGGQASQEDEASGGGLFTQTIIRALSEQSATADYDQNGYVEYMEMVDYVQHKFQQRGRREANEQTPWLARRTLFGDFPLVPVSY